MITDTNAVKPADWLEDEPEVIPDPDAEKPEEWDVSSCPNTNVVPADPAYRMRRMETGSHQWSPTPPVRMPPVVDLGSSQRSGTQTTR